MRPKGEAARLFDALSRTAARAFADERLLSCQVLAKGPDQGDLLRRFLRRSPPPAPGLAGGPLLLPRLLTRYLAANCLHLAFMLLTALLARLRGWQSALAGGGGPESAKKASKSKAATSASKFNPAQKPSLVVIDSFAVLPRIAAEGVWRDLYLPGLAAEAEARGYPALTLYRLYGSRNPLVLWRALGVLAAAGPGLLETHLLRPGDWLRLVRHLLLYPISLLRLIRSLKTCPPDSPERFIREALIATAGQCALTGEARRLAGLRLAQNLSSRPGPDDRKNPEAAMAGQPRAHVISWYENQTVNKTFLRGLRQGMGRGSSGSGDESAIFCTGAQLFLWPAALLNNHADDAEAALGLAPDRVLVNGPHFLPENSRQNYAIGPSLRYAHLFDRDRPRPAADGDLLVLLSYHPAETRRVLEAARELSAVPKGGQGAGAAGNEAGVPGAAGRGAGVPGAAGSKTGDKAGAGGGPGLIFRFHPATSPQDYADLLPPGARFSSGPLDRALASASAVMGAASGSLAEAAAMGLPVLALETPEAEGGLNYLPEQGRGLLWQSISQGKEAPAALEALRLRPDEEGEENEAGRDQAGRDEAVAAFRDLLFTRPTPEAVSRMLSPH